MPSTLASSRMPPDGRVGWSGGDAPGIPLRLIAISFLPGISCDSGPDQCGLASG
ncbi:MAG TPA: hypothetical protein VIJ00_02830 [Nakamurella sp.]